MDMKSKIIGSNLRFSPHALLKNPVCSLLVPRNLNSRPSLLGNGVGALRVTRKQIAQPVRSRSNDHSSGVLGVQMNLFSRVARVIKSYANAIISSFEDPEKIIEQAVIDMNDDLRKLRHATAQVLASQKQMENKYKASEQSSVDWYRRAQLALGKGDEDLAREALLRRKSYVDNASVLKAQLDQQKGIVENLISNTQLLENKIHEARSKKDTLKARAQSAKTAAKVNGMVGNVNTSSALAAFEKMEEKVFSMEFQADALNQLTNNDLEGKFELLESSSIDDELANLKELYGRTKKKVLLLGNTSVPSTSLPYPFRDSEIEIELNELRRKTNEI